MPMKLKTDAASYDVGVIVGRFQVPELHDGHRELINTVVSRHDKVVVFLGNAPVRGTINNPLDFQARQQMLHEEYPELVVLYIDDNPSDAAWSKRLDGMVANNITPSQSVVLYGARDSFIAHYEGRLPVQELESDSYMSGTEVRRRVGAASTKADPAFRAGAVWQTFNQHNNPMPTVDVAIFNDDYTKILLGRKTTDPEDKYRLIGGFVNSGDTWEATARREVQEETHLAITDPEYIGSFVIDDWRYRNEARKITSTLFRAKVFSGSPKADDDIAELRWFDFDVSIERNVVDSHLEMVRRLLVRAEFSK